MVLEVVGARYLLRDFGGSFYVWISQIGVILIALAVGYFAGGALVDRTGRITVLAWMLIAAGVFTILIPEFSPKVLDWIVMRHPLDRDIPPLWQKLDPAAGSALIFLWPCVTLAMLSPCMVRLSTERLSRVGRASGRMSSVSAAGNIAGVIVSGYFLLDRIALSSIFRIAGILIILIGAACLAMDQWFADTNKRKNTA
jgi:MFS family permease